MGGDIPVDEGEVPDPLEVALPLRQELCDLGAKPPTGRQRL